MAGARRRRKVEVEAGADAATSPDDVVRERRPSRETEVVSSASVAESLSPTTRLRRQPRRLSTWRRVALWRAFAGVFVGCCVNGFALEELVRADPGIGNVVTASQFVFISGMGLLHHLNWRWAPGESFLKKRSAPMRFYFKTTAVFLVVSLINNVVFVFNISLPFHMLFRSCSLVVSMAVGMFCFGKSYSRQQILSCLLITAGVIGATVADSASKMSADCCNNGLQTSAHVDVPDDATYSGIFAWGIGVALLTVSLLLSALQGHVQEWGYNEYGRHSEESMFYSHLLSLPMFVFLMPDLIKHFMLLFSLPPVGQLSMFGFQLDVPYVFILFVNLTSQYVCVQGVYSITCLSTSLTCTFTITVRKFVSLLFSVLYFSNPFTLYHWISSFLVFGGTVMYSTSASAIQHPDSSITKKSS